MENNILGIVLCGSNPQILVSKHLASLALRGSFPVGGLGGQVRRSRFLEIGSENTGNAKNKDKRPFMLLSLVVVM